jgi:uncharacterized protein
MADLIVCPACHQRMTAGERGEELICAGCGRHYPIEDGLPVLLVERATTGRG